MNKSCNLFFGHAGIAADLDPSRFSDQEAWNSWDLVVVAEGLEFWTDLAGVEEVDGHLLVLGYLVEFWCEAVARPMKRTAPSLVARRFCACSTVTLVKS
ncbi:TPA: hypothetical protein U1236_001709 [Streptococcus suis]|nr:hypothetical protein [Streptococcus suis]